MIEQYFTYMGGLFQGDLGTSLKTKRPVTEEIGERFMPTFWLTVLEYGLGSRGWFANWCRLRNQTK